MTTHLSGLLRAAALLLALAAPAHANESSPHPDMLQAALQAVAAQRDQALNEGVRLSAQLTLAQREIARLREEAKAARAPAAAEPAK